jgi:hypothetical protein
MACAVDRRAFTLFDAWRNLPAPAGIRSPVLAKRWREGRKSSRPGLHDREYPIGGFRAGPAISGARCAKAAATELTLER